MAKFVEVRDGYWVNVDSISHFERIRYGMYAISFDGIQMRVDEDTINKIVEGRI